MRRDKALKFMREAMFKAVEFSKDPSTKVGALILGSSAYELRSSGYNGMPRGCDDSCPRRQQRPEKYLWYEHAERNAIYNASRVGTALEGGILVVTLFPCMDCARAVVQAGIREVVSVTPQGCEAKARWEEHFSRSEALLGECGVELVLLNPDELIETASELVKPMVEWFFMQDQGKGAPGR